MKALTLYQPWATLVAIGAKTIETRGWRTHYRGPLAIHAAKTFPKWAEQFSVDCLPCCHALLAGGYRDPNDLLLGSVVATADLVDCREIVVINPCGDARFMEMPSDPEVRFGHYTPGRYGWTLRNIVRLQKPVPAVGHQGLWDWQGDVDR